jgi:hypothetical protein
MNENFVEQSKKIKLNNNSDYKKGITVLIKKKIDYIGDIIRDCVISSNENKRLKIYRNIDLQTCYSSLNELYNSNKNVLSKIDTYPIDECIEELQKIIDRLSLIMTSLGTKNMEDLLYITFGSEFKEIKNNPVLNSKLQLILKYFHPTGYKITNDKKKKNRKKKRILLP